MEIKLNKRALKKGVEIIIPGTVANPADPKGYNCPIYIEVYEG